LEGTRESISLRQQSPRQALTLVIRTAPVLKDGNGMKYMKTLILLFMLTLNGSALAQQAKDQPQPGRYQLVTHQIVAGVSHLFLLDTWTGRSWKLIGNDAWHPIPRLDTPEQVAEWKKANPPPSKKP
jgi:hypothetical protein